MVLTRKAPVGKLVVLYAVAVLIGLMLAVAAAKSSGAIGRANATTHCTNYFPNSYTADHNCTTDGTIISNTWGGTCCTALRDSNCMTVAVAEPLEVWYGEYTSSTATTRSLCQTQSIGYQIAYCKARQPGGSYGVLGHCRTNWHD
jgi:hypothetical protein